MYNFKEKKKFQNSKRNKPKSKKNLFERIERTKLFRKCLKIFLQKKTGQVGLGGQLIVVCPENKDILFV